MVDELDEAWRYQCYLKEQWSKAADEKNRFVQLLSASEAVREEYAKRFAVLTAAVQTLREAITKTLEHVEDSNVERTTAMQCTLCYTYRNDVLRAALEATKEFDQ